MQKKIINILDHGARGDGLTLNTTSIQAAIDRIAQEGGGTVLVPAGTFLTGTLNLVSHLTLHLADGAILLASPRMEDYPAQAFHHDEWGPTTSLIFACGCQDIHFEGPGTIDLNDEAFMDRTKAKVGDHFTAEKLAQLSPEQFAQTTCLALARPVQPIFFHQCSGLSFRDLTLRRSPCWSLTFSVCEKITIRSMRIRNHLRTPNADGVHLCGCRDVVISHCDFICGDDCVALTGITDWSQPCEQVVITDCVFQSASAGVRLGHLQSKVRDVSLRDLRINDSNRGIALFAGEGGWIERVKVTRVHLHTRLTPGHWWGAGEPLIICAAEAPSAVIRELHFEEITAKSEQGIVMVGSGGNIQEVTLQAWTLELLPGPNRPLLGEILDLRPTLTRPAPPAPAIPWLLAAEVGTLKAHHIRLCAATDLDPTALFISSPAVECSDVTVLYAATQ